MKTNQKISVKLFVILFFILMVFILSEVIALSINSLNEFNLTLWDDTDSNVKRSVWNTYFYVNYTNSTSGGVISNGNCTIRFQNYSSDYDGWFNLTFNSSSEQFEYNRTFNYKGTYLFEVNCTNSSLSINNTDNFTITNSIPVITRESGGDWIDFDGVSQNHDSWQCTEDTVCYYNFSLNVSDVDINDVLSYDFNYENTTLTNFTLNVTLGMLLINITHSNNTGNDKRIELKVKDDDAGSLWQSGLLDVDIAQVNDAPVFNGLSNQSFNASALFEYLFNVTDEENNTPFVLNITFIGCGVAEWSTRNCSNSSGRELFNSSQYSFNSLSGLMNLSFTPLRNDIGSYTINFSVMDNSSLGNKTTSEIINFTVLNVNTAPYFRYVCDNERNTTENSEFTCWINVSDIDETNNLTLNFNYTWFAFNNTLSNSVSVNVNSSTSFNGSAMVNFTANDSMIGNWSVNLSITDTGSPVRGNSSVFWFFIDNIEDVVTLDAISNYTIYENYTIYVSANDDDLLVPDKSVKNESLTFASNTSWVSISSNSFSGSNETAKIEIDYDTIYGSLGSANYTVRINVSDTGGNYAERNFTIRILGDNAPVWNDTIATEFKINEETGIYLNFSQNVSDPDADDINFSYVNDSSFPSFNLNSTTGVINFTSDDADVGYHNITINATDGKLNSLKSFNFTILNVNDVPFIQTIVSGDLINASLSSGNVICGEDNYTSIVLWIQDDDFKIPSSQRSFYNESLSFNVTIEGVNTSLLNFVKDSSFPTTGNNKSKYEALFIPLKSEVGSYNITVNVSDFSNASYVLEFNLTVNSIEHNPVLGEIFNKTFAVNRNFYTRFNVTDTEDGDSLISGNINFTFSYSFLSGNNIFNSTIFNSSSGEINITFNSSQGGLYHLNITVNDTSNRIDFDDFWLYVYDIPSVNSPSVGYSFNLTENTLSNLTFTVNHSVGDNLTYEFYIDAISYNGSDFNYSRLSLRNNLSYYGNNTNLTWSFTPNFTDETYGLLKNLTLIVYPQSSGLANNTAINTTINWGVNISHANSPVVFSGNIGDMQATYNSDITLDLSDYFSDSDYNDGFHNDTLSFLVQSNTTPSYITKSFSGLQVTFSSLIAISELLNITVFDSNSTDNNITNATSNNFQIKFTSPTIVTTPTSGGGGSSVPYSLKIITPGQISAFAYEKIEIPIQLVNNGKKDFKSLDLLSSAFKDGNIFNQLDSSFDEDYFSTLKVGETKNITLTLFFKTYKEGVYEVILNATSKSPKYSDWGKIYIDFQKINDSEVEEILLFTEEFIVQNPECLELTEALNEARQLFEDEKLSESRAKAEEIIGLCKEFVSQTSLATHSLGSGEKIGNYVSITLFGSLLLGMIYYYVSKRRIKKGIRLPRAG